VRELLWSGGRHIERCRGFDGFRGARRQTASPITVQMNSTVPAAALPR